MMVYRALRLLFKLYLRVAHRIAIRGRELLPATGPLILCANHTSYLDSMLLALCTDRQIRFLIYRDFYDHPLLHHVVKWCGAIPVNQTGSDTDAFKTSLAVLNGGGVLGIFPEGKLSLTGLPSPGQPGAFLLAATTGAPLVPVTISGAFFAYPKRRRLPRPGVIRMTVHAPVTIDPVRRKDREYLKGMADRVMRRIGRRIRRYYRMRGRKRRGMSPAARRPPSRQVEATSRPAYEDAP